MTAFYQSDIWSDTFNKIDFWHSCCFEMAKTGPMLLTLRQFKVGLFFFILPQIGTNCDVNF